MPREMTNRAVTLARISGGPGQDKVLSHGGQDSAMDEYRGKKGLAVVKQFHEVASGLDSEKRPVFLEMINFVLDQNNCISHVIFYDLSRFSRSKSDPYLYLKLLDENDIIIHSALDGTNSEDDNEFLWSIQFLFNNDFSRRVSFLTIRGQSESVKLGNDISPVVTYGYLKFHVKDGRMMRPRWKPHPEHAKYVQLMFKMRSQGHLPMAICNHLNGLGVPAPRGGLWTTNTISNILRNIAYLGYSQVGKKSTSAFPRHRRNRELVQNANAHPALVSVTLFNKVQKLMPKRPRAERQPPNSHSSPNPLSTRVKCMDNGHMANMVVANSTKGGKKLTCAVKKRSGVSYCQTEDIKLNEFLRTLGTSMKERLSDSSIIRDQLEIFANNSRDHIAQEKNRQATYAKRLKAIEQEKTNLMSALLKASKDYPENVEDFNKALSTLNKEKTELEQKQTEMDEQSNELMTFLADPDGLREALQELGEQIDPEDLDVTSRFLKSFVNRVDISGDQATVYYAMPLANTVETPDGHRASATIEREGPEILLEQCAPLPLQSTIHRRGNKWCHGTYPNSWRWTILKISTQP